MTSSRKYNQLIIMVLQYVEEVPNVEAQLEYNVHVDRHRKLFTYLNFFLPY